MVRLEIMGVIRLVLGNDMFEQTFKNIDNALRKDTGVSSG